MTFSINEFKAKGLIYGGARPSLFRVEMPLIPNSTGGTNNITDVISFTAKAASLPPSLIDYIDVPYMSRKIKVSGDRTFPDWVITVMNDEDFPVRGPLEEWHQAINARERNRMFGAGLSPISMYKRDLVVHQYSKTGNNADGNTSNIRASNGSDDASPIRSYTLVGAFPTSIDGISLDWDTVNQIEQFDVTFAYDYWEPRVIDSNEGTAFASVAAGIQQ